MTLAKSLQAKMQSIDAVVFKPFDRIPDDRSEDESVEGLDIRADSEGWNDVDAADDQETVVVKCLMCEETFGDAVTMAAHCQKQHDFDFAKIKQDNSE